MDSLTQGVLGASIGEVMLGKQAGNKAALAGAVIATIPDLDVILYAFYNSYEMLSIHRGFSHSIVFSFVAAPISAFVLSKIKSFKNSSFGRLFLFSWVTLFTHSLLDAFTTYGTQLLLPFSDNRVGFDSINVVDPAYTFPLILGLVLSLWIYKSKPSRAFYSRLGLFVSTLYLIGTLVNKKIVNSCFHHQFEKKEIESLLTVPVGVANINWYGVAKNKDSLFLQEYSILSGFKNSPEAFPVHESFLEELPVEIAEKMRWFAKGFYTIEKIGGKIRIYNLQVDMRGIVKTEKTKAPTKGFFEISTENGQVNFSSGSLK